MTYRKKCENDINLTGVDEINNIIYDYKTQLEHTEKFEPILNEIKCIKSAYFSHLLPNLYMKEMKKKYFIYNFCRNCRDIEQDGIFPKPFIFGCKCNAECKKCLKHSLLCEYLKQGEDCLGV